MRLAGVMACSAWTRLAAARGPLAGHHQQCFRSWRYSPKMLSHDVYHRARAAPINAISDVSSRTDHFGSQWPTQLDVAPWYILRWVHVDTYGGQLTMLVEAELLRDLVSDIFEAAGCSTAEAARVARRLVRANLTGHDSHGVSRTARYVAQLRDGVQVANQDAEVVSRTSAYAVVDGHFGMGQTVGE